jgi:four helix bundle protein
MGNYRDLVVWQRSYKLVVAIYDATRQFPSSERYNLTGQLQRAASSIAINIAEGAGRRWEGDQARFLRIARGSAHAVSCELMLARDLGFLPAAMCAELLDEAEQVGAMLTGWLRTHAQRSGRATGSSSRLTTHD